VNFVTISSTQVLVTGLKSTDVESMAEIGAMYDGLSEDPNEPDGVANGAAEYSDDTSGPALECHGVLTGPRDSDWYADAEGAGGATEAAGLSYVCDSNEPGRAPALDDLLRGAEEKS
jgi:hypothetical protein